MFAGSGHGGEFGGHLPDPGGGFTFGDACDIVGQARRRRGFAGGSGRGLEVWRSQADCRWYCLIARGFAISGGRMMALHSDIREGGRLL
ncbi:MAG: hypothetical protein C5S48_05995 [Candidatus Methanogaster sp.]|nr:MAG: hypothetical protein C5S48_05995 [ANME-2 cluster archaeon]